MTSLNTIEIGAPKGQGMKTAFILHGILGSARNWRTFSKRLAAAHPQWTFVLVDLRNHGQSPRVEGEQSLDAVAHDLELLAIARGEWPSVVIGHSYGGKVALAYGRRHPEGLESVWVLDSDPGRVEQLPPDNEISQVLNALHQVNMPAPSRQEVVNTLASAGMTPSITGWMTTNLHRAEDGFRWRFQLDLVEEMLQAYLSEDLWPWLSQTQTEVNIVTAERGGRWRERQMRNFKALPPGHRVKVTELPNSGHWVHVDNPDGLLTMLAPTFLRQT